MSTDLESEFRKAVREAGINQPVRAPDGMLIDEAKRIAAEVRDEMMPVAKVGFPAGDEAVMAAWRAVGSSKPDNVDHPAHYTTGSIECFDAMMAMLSREEMIGYLRGNSFKYRWRFRAKGGAEDLRKAEWYEKKLLQIIEVSV